MEIRGEIKRREGFVRESCSVDHEGCFQTVEEFNLNSIEIAISSISKSLAHSIPMS